MPSPFLLGIISVVIHRHHFYLCMYRHFCMHDQGFNFCAFLFYKFHQFNNSVSIIRSPFYFGEKIISDAYKYQSLMLYLIWTLYFTLYFLSENKLKRVAWIFRLEYTLNSVYGWYQGNETAHVVEIIWLKLPLNQLVKSSLNGLLWGPLRKAEWRQDQRPAQGVEAVVMEMTQAVTSVITSSYQSWHSSIDEDSGALLLSS